ncbi:hypothetical protein JZ785_23340 [Alicyclobacillus curvatus]|nr:hypothetical protein JZ785_23340 [Alicyclobacillus curvatus]
MPPLHPLIIHFPIALFVVAVLFDGITAFTQKDSLIPATRLLYLLGYLGTLAALITGDMLKDERSAMLPHGLLTLHEWLAITFAIWFSVLLVFRLRKHWYPSKPYAVVAVIGLGLLVAVGHTGGSMAWPSLKGSVALSGSTKLAVAANDGATNAANVTSAGATGSGAGTGGGASGSGAKTEAASGSTAGSGAKTGAASGNTAGSGAKTGAASGSAAGFGAKTGAASGSAAGSRGGTKTSSTPSSSSTVSSASTASQHLYQLGAQYFVQDCQTCHSLNMAEQYFGTDSKSQWTQVVETMQSYAGGAISNNQAQAIIEYVSQQK